MTSGNVCRNDTSNQIGVSSTCKGSILAATRGSRSARLRRCALALTAHTTPPAVAERIVATDAVSVRLNGKRQAKRLSPVSVPVGAFVPAKPKIASPTRVSNRMREQREAE